MFRKILFPTDFSDYSLKTLEYVVGLKDVGAREVILAHVIPALEEYPVTLGIKDKTKLEMQKHERILKDQGFNVISRVEMGAPAQQILSLAEAEKASIIVAGSHGKGLLEEVLIGSVSERIAREAKVPVLIVRYKVLEDLEGRHLASFSAQLFRKILFPTDFSFSSERALEFVRALKGAGTEEVVITHVVDDRYLFPYRAKEARRESGVRLEVIKKELQERGMKAKVQIPLGAPLVEILRLSEEEDVSLIVVGSHGKGFVREMVLGSVSENIIRQAKRPVLVVHEKDIFVV